MEVTEALLLRELRTVWARVNADRFDGALTPCVLELSRRAGDLGRWTRGTRTLSLAWSLVVDRPWGEVVAVLEHEMAHQYVEEVLGILDETAHGRTFREVCAERGIDARAAGRPEDDGASAPAVVRRIRKLLALASSPVEAEARAAARLAMRLMLRHNVSETEAQSRPTFAVRQVGAAAVRLPRHQQLLAGLLARRFFVEVTVVPALDVGALRWGRVVELAGTPDNVEVAVWVWELVLATAQRALREAAAAGRLKGAAARQRYLDGVVIGFREKLDEEADLARVEEGLVWVGDPSLDRFVAARYPSRRKGRRLGVRADAAFAEGREAGRRITLRRPIRERRSGPAPLLPGPRGDG